MNKKKLSPTKKGKISEHHVIAELLFKGYEVYVPVLKDHKYAYLVRMDKGEEFREIKTVLKTDVSDAGAIEKLGEITRKENKNPPKLLPRVKGKACELLAIEKFLSLGLEVYIPVEDTWGVDCVLKREGEGKSSYMDVQIKQRDGDHYWVQWVRPRKNYWYVFISFESDRNPYWVIPSTYLKRIGKSQKRKGRELEVYRAKVAKKNEIILKELAESYEGNAWLKKWGKGERYV